MLVKFGGACKPRVWNGSGKSRRLPRGYGLYGQGAIDGLLVMESNQEQLSTVYEYDADEAVSKVDGNYELEPRVDRHSRQCQCQCLASTAKSESQTQIRVT